jgi:hypothetical protein
MMEITNPARYRELRLRYGTNYSAEFLDEMERIHELERTEHLWMTVPPTIDLPMDDNPRAGDPEHDRHAGRPVRRHPPIDTTSAGRRH